MIPELVIIVPYRDRECHLNCFKATMKYLLDELTETPYEIVLSEQDDNREFNRGATKNMGFLYIKDKYPNDYREMTFVFNDIDLFPGVKGIIPKYKTTHGTVKHFYGFTFALGGVVSITGRDFESLNGYPNYWGWGFEDNCLQKRCIEKKLHICRKSFYQLANKDWIYIFHGSDRKLDNKVVHKFTGDKMGSNGLSTISFQRNTLKDVEIDEAINMKKISYKWEIPEKFNKINYEIVQNPQKIVQKKVNMSDIMNFR